MNKLSAFSTGTVGSGIPQNLKSVSKIIELLAFALIMPVVGFFLFRSNPLGLTSGFPWVMVAPIVFAARYGSVSGFACALLSAISFLFIGQITGGVFTHVVALSIGTVVLAIVVGDASSAWRTRSQQSDAENQYLRHRLKEFSKDYHVLKVSHGQLEEFMAGQRLSLRRALQQSRPLLSADSDGLQAGSELMAIFAQFCSVQVAGLYAMSSDSQVEKKAVAVHGNMGDLPIFDPLLKMAIKERQLVSVKLESHATDVHEGGLLAVVPIVDSQDQLHGVLAVRDMHFMAFQQQNLNILALLGGYVGDMLTRSKGSSSSRSGWFLAELDTALRFAKSHSVQSSLLCMQFEESDYADVVAKMVSVNIRSLDASWLPQTNTGRCVVVILLPLISESHCNAYLRRVGESVRNEFNLELQDLLYDVQTMQISLGDTRESCLNFINESTGFSHKSTDDDVVTNARVKRVA